jgi:hypothetical protein
VSKNKVAPIPHQKKTQNGHQEIVLWFLNFLMLGDLNIFILTSKDLFNIKKEKAAILKCVYSYGNLLFFEIHTQ